MIPEDDPDFCSSEDSLIDFASDESAEGSDNFDEPKYDRQDFCQDMITYAHECQEGRHEGDSDVTATSAERTRHLCTRWVHWLVTLQC